MGQSMKLGLTDPSWQWPPECFHPEQKQHLVTLTAPNLAHQITSQPLSHHVLAVELQHWLGKNTVAENF